MSHHLFSSFRGFLLIAGVTVVVVIAIMNNNSSSVSDQISTSALTSRRQLKSISKQKERNENEHENHKTYDAFSFQRDPQTIVKDSASFTLITKEHLPHQGQIMPFQLAQNAADWCMPVTLPHLNYNNCDPNKPVNRIPLFGGLTNALKYILLGVIKSFEEDRCFYIDESRSH